MRQLTGRNKIKNKKNPSHSSAPPGLPSGGRAISPSCGNACSGHREPLKLLRCVTHVLPASTSQWLNPAETALWVTLGTGLSCCPTSPFSQTSRLDHQQWSSCPLPFHSCPLGQRCVTGNRLGQPKTAPLPACPPGPAPAPHPCCHQPSGDISDRCHRRGTSQPPWTGVGGIWTSGKRPCPWQGDEL